MSSKAWRTVLLPDPESPVRITSWPARGRDAGEPFAKRLLALDTALVRAGYTHVLAVFGDSAASDVDAVVVQFLGDLLVRQGLGGVFFFDHFLDETLERQQRHAATFGTVHGLAEERTQLENALRCVRIFAGHGAADGRRM